MHFRLIKVNRRLIHTLTVVQSWYNITYITIENWSIDHQFDAPQSTLINIIDQHWCTLEFLKGSRRINLKVNVHQCSSMSIDTGIQCWLCWSMLIYWPVLDQCSFVVYINGSRLNNTLRSTFEWLINQNVYSGLCRFMISCNNVLLFCTSMDQDWTTHLHVDQPSNDWLTKTATVAYVDSWFQVTMILYM